MVCIINIDVFRFSRVAEQKSLTLDCVREWLSRRQLEVLLVDILSLMKYYFGVCLVSTQKLIINF